MNFLEKHLDETIRAIGRITRDNYNSLISVKKIREVYEIDSTNNSKVGFYWRCLQDLEQQRILKRIGTQIPKKYRVQNYYDFFERLYHSYVNRRVMATSSD
ncbi:MAG: hypothetical protein ACXABO_11690 [Promethearchaeota archaeon]|jgi:hypothetical protein